MTSQLTASERIRQSLARIADLLGSPTGSKQIDAEFAEITAIANEIDTENNEDIEAIEARSAKSIQQDECAQSEAIQMSHAVDMLGIIARELRWIRISNELPK